MKRPLTAPSTTCLIGDLSCSRSQRATHRLKASRFVSLLVWAFLVVQIPLAAQVRQVRRVLILNDLGTVSSAGFAEIDQTIFAELQKSPYQVELYHESLELTLFPDQVSQRRFREGFIAKYADRKPDVIIAAGSASLKFVAESHERFLRDTPIVFCAILGDIPQQLKPDMHFTGVLGRLHPKETLSAALHMLPGTEQVVVVGGVGKFDQAFEAVAKQGLRSYESKLQFTYLTDLPMSTLLERLKHPPSNTIVYHTSITLDAAGERFVDSAQSVPLVADAANAPVFVMDDADLRDGAVGGDLVNWADDGRVAAEMAVRVLSGGKPEDMPIVTGNHAYIFDWRALQHWGLKESSLPTGSTVIFRDLSLWARAKWILIAGLLIILFLSALAAYLQHSRAQVRQARDAELELTGLLINAQEKERSRLAAELHDDFSQRLALLAFELEGVEEALPASSDGLKRRVQKAQESASELGADLHTVSHRLHSSTLEALGLVPGVSALCKEFTAHQGIPIDFSFLDIPAHVGSDVSLCLFRIVQEALQNLKKHSGAAKAQVMLRKVKERLFLSVIDEGRGFDIKEAKKNAGLGIGSMQGRARLLGGQFEIQSEPGKGTRIEVWVPIAPQTEPMKN